MSALDIIVIGLSHKTAPLSLREQLAASTDLLPARLAEISAASGVEEAALVSTCNRVEVYAAVQDATGALSTLRNVLSRWSGRDLDAHLYEFIGTEAVQHVFRVASSLDSMVIGEPQILGQMKDAFAAATEAKTTGTVLNRCFHRAFQVAKHVRNDTGVGRSSVSMSTIAVELARSIFDRLQGKRVLLLGAGEMAELAARHLVTAGIDQITVANRNLERARQVAASVGGQAHSIDETTTLLEIVDIVISSTASPTFILDETSARRVMKARRQRPLFIIDLAVPRDIDPRVGGLENVYLFDVDDLQQVADRNRSHRRKEANQAEKMVAQEASEFVNWIRSLAVVPTIVALREKFFAAARDELQRAGADLDRLSPDERQAIERLTESLIKKLLHEPLVQLKREGKEGGVTLVSATQRLFNIEIEHEAETADRRNKATD